MSSIFQLRLRTGTGSDSRDSVLVGILMSQRYAASYTMTCTSPLLLFLFCLFAAETKIVRNKGKNEKKKKETRTHAGGSFLLFFFFSFRTGGQRRLPQKCVLKMFFFFFGEREKERKETIRKRRSDGRGKSEW